MPKREVLILEAAGERFRFYFDREHPEVLHITRRHGTVPEEAIRTFFEGDIRPWDETRGRFETVTEALTIYWTRHPHDQSVIVISCFKPEDG